MSISLIVLFIISLEAYSQTLLAPCDELGFWLERPSGFPFAIVKNLNFQNTVAYIAGMRNGDIVLRLNDQPVWELTIGEVLLILLRDPDEANNGILRVEWLAATHPALAQRALRQLRHDRISGASISVLCVDDKLTLTGNLYALSNSRTLIVDACKTLMQTC